jgi:hypothetical protein
MIATALTDLLALRVPMIQPAVKIVSNIEMQARELLTAVGGTVSSPSP